MSQLQHRLGAAATAEVEAEKLARWTGLQQDVEQMWLKPLYQLPRCASAASERRPWTRSGWRRLAPTVRAMPAALADLPGPRRHGAGGRGARAGPPSRSADVS